MKKARRLKFKYRVSVINESTLDEVWHARLSRLSVFLWGSLMVLLTFVLMVLLIMFTPLRHYLPGYGDASVRQYLLSDALRVDSLEQQVRLQENYIAMLQSVLTQAEDGDSIPTADSLRLMANETLAAPTDAEREFVQEYERDERYNLHEAVTARNQTTLVFLKPVKGIVTGTFADADNRSYGITLSAAPEEPVVATLDGVVVASAYTFDAEWLMVIQHKEGYLSCYRNLNRPTRHVGDRVAAGETIAIAGGRRQDEAGRQIVFELWKQGVAINPEDVIAF